MSFYFEFPKISPLTAKTPRPFWSVLIPTYKRTQYLAQALKSVVNQAPDSSQMQIIVLNDGAASSVQAEIRSIVEQVGGSRVEWYAYPHNSGNNAAFFNQCLTHARGEWIHILHDDDWVEPNFYARLQSEILRFPQASAACCRYSIVNQQGQKTWESWIERETPGILVTNWIERIVLQNRLQFSCVVIRRSTYEAIGGYCPQARGSADWEMWKRVAVHKPVLHVPELLAYYRLHDKSEGGLDRSSGEWIVNSLNTVEISKSYLPKKIADLLCERTYCFKISFYLKEIQQDILTLKHEKAICNLTVLLEYIEKLEIKAKYQFQEQLLSLKNLSKALLDYTSYVFAIQTDRIDSESTQLLRQIRYQLSQKLSNYADLKLKEVLLGELGFYYRALMQTQLREDCLLDIEKDWVAQLQQKLKQDANSVAVKVALLLYVHPSKIPDISGLNSLQLFGGNSRLLQIAERTPLVWRGVDDVNLCYEYLLRRYSTLVRQTTVEPDMIYQALSNLRTGLLYFTEKNPKLVQQKKAQLLENTLVKLNYDLEYKFFPRGKHRKLKIGVVSQGFRGRTDTFLALPFFEHLDRSKFEVYLYAMQDFRDREEQCPVETYCHQIADRFVGLSPNVKDSVALIRKDDLDIVIISSNITAIMNPLLLISAHRLARCQMARMGSPITTGLSNIDYYISGEFCETEDNPEQFYTEKLILLKNTGFAFSYCDRFFLPIDKDRLNEHKLHKKENELIFVSCANFCKITPEVRRTWIEILSNVSSSKLVLIPFAPSWGMNFGESQFIRVFQQELIQADLGLERVTFIAPVENRYFVQALIKQADIYLDTFPHTGSNSLVDTLLVGVPPIVREGNQLRSRHGSALLKDINVRELIVKSESEYVQLAVQLARNSQFRQDIKEKIQAKMQLNPSFLDSFAYAREAEKMFQSVYQYWCDNHQNRFCQNQKLDRGNSEISVTIF